MDSDRAARLPPVASRKLASSNFSNRSRPTVANSGMRQSDARDHLRHVAAVDRAERLLHVMRGRGNERTSNCRRRTLVPEPYAAQSLRRGRGKMSIENRVVPSCRTEHPLRRLVELFPIHDDHICGSPCPMRTTLPKTSGLERRDHFPRSSRIDRTLRSRSTSHTRAREEPPHQPSCRREQPLT